MCGDSNCAKYHQFYARCEAYLPKLILDLEAAKGNYDQLQTLAMLERQSQVFLDGVEKQKQSADHLFKSYEAMSSPPSPSPPPASAAPPYPLPSVAPLTPPRASSPSPSPSSTLSTPALTPTSSTPLPPSLGPSPRLTMPYSLFASRGAPRAGRPLDRPRSRAARRRMWWWAAWCWGAIARGARDVIVLVGAAMVCGNRASQRGVEVRLKIARDKKKGWCLFADQAIEKGRFVCEYAGELLMTKEARAQQKEYDELASSAQYDLISKEFGYLAITLTSEGDQPLGKMILVTLYRSITDFQTSLTTEHSDPFFESLWLLQEDSLNLTLFFILACTPFPIGFQIPTQLADIGSKVAASSEFNVYLKGLLSSQESKLENLEKERDCTFKIACEMFPAAA
ncbi:hypothetical protein NL676_018233 [Syzygium grande]|nr:hypothetical protein NL676_018233 [Syzygium grande]